eukprot:8430886-Alexandrium_andersonii.AAC.1
MPAEMATVICALTCAVRQRARRAPTSHSEMISFNSRNFSSDVQAFAPRGWKARLARNSTRSQASDGVYQPGAAPRFRT